MMKTALFLMVPHLSHYFPTFGLARLLQRQGYTIIYSGSPPYQSVIEQEGFLFRPMDYLEEFVIRKLSVAFGLWIKSRIDPAYTNVRYRWFLTSMRQVEELVIDSKPTLILLDDTLGHYYTCLSGKATIMQVSTRLSSRKHPSVPPLNSFYIPQKSPATSLITNGKWWWHIRRRRLYEGLQRLIFRDCSDVDFLRRHKQRKGIDWRAIRDEKVAFYDAVAGLPTLVLAPKSLDFENTQFSTNEHYLYIADQRSERPYFSAEYIQAIERVISHKQIKKTRIVYVALGTLSTGQGNQARQLLLNIIEALGGDEMLDVVIATGGINLSLSDVPENICCLPVVPQIDMLKHCDVMVTHGGFGSFKECIEAGVPMLVYPLNTSVDQPGNSARIVSLGLGIRGSLNESPAKITKKVHQLLDSPIYKSNCRRAQDGLLIEAQQAEGVLKQIGLWSPDRIRSHKSIVHI